MAIGPERKYMTAAQASVADIDVGLRQYMLKVYDYMAGGLVLTGLVAFAVAQSPALIHAITHTLGLGAGDRVTLLVGSSARINTMSVGSARLFFWAYAAVLGALQSSIFVALYRRVHRHRALLCDRRHVRGHELWLPRAI
jgi:FtsH-binding integral membrane protein